MSETLRECPFCGGGARMFMGITNYISVKNSKYVTAVGCINKNCVAFKLSPVKNNTEEAIKAWNTRAPDYREALEECVNLLEDVCNEVNEDELGATLEKKILKCVTKARSVLEGERKEKDD